jgi:hypothetical protein
MKKKSCNKPCSPSDYYPGGKCDKNGCYETVPEPIKRIIKIPGSFVVTDESEVDSKTKEIFEAIQKSFPGAIVVHVNTKKP